MHKFLLLAVHVFFVMLEFLLNFFLSLPVHTLLQRGLRNMLYTSKRLHSACKRVQQVFVAFYSRGIYEEFFLCAQGGRM